VTIDLIDKGPRTEPIEDHSRFLERVCAGLMITEGDEAASEAQMGLAVSTKP
jgi:hypothetical protein